MRPLTIGLVAATIVLAAACGDPAATDQGDAVPPTTTRPDRDATPEPGLPGGTSWVVASFGLDGADDPVLPEAVPTLEVAADGMAVGGTTGCNSWFGTLAVGADGGISITGLGQTEMACLGDGVMEQEQRFLEALSRVTSVVAGDAGLTLEAEDGSAVVRLVAAPPAPDLPISGEWRLTTFVDGEVASSLLTGTAITLVVDLEAGTLSGEAGCNRFRGGLDATAAGDGPGMAVVVGPLASTRMACEPGVMEQEQRFLAALGDAVEILSEGGLLTVATADGRVLLFEPAAA